MSFQEWSSGLASGGAGHGGMTERGGGTGGRGSGRGGRGHVMSRGGKGRFWFICRDPSEIV